MLKFEARKTKFETSKNDQNRNFQNKNAHFILSFLFIYNFGYLNIGKILANWSKRDSGAIVVGNSHA